MRLTGLLSREGCRVALLSFRTETYMALGAAADAFFYKNTTYTYVETINFSCVDIPADTLMEGETLQSNPVIIPIWNGTKIYTSGKKTRSISNVYDRSAQSVRNREPQIKSLEADLAMRQEKITQLESQMQGVRSSDNIQNYNAQVSVPNGLVSDYNTRLIKYKILFARYENAVQVHNYIIEHNFDRTGIYAYVKQNWP